MALELEKELGSIFCQLVEQGRKGSPIGPKATQDVADTLIIAILLE
jgi:hypothetical protein